MAARLLLLLLALRAIIVTNVVADVVTVHLAVVAVAVVVIIIVDGFAASTALLVEARLAFAQHAEIMLRELEIGFGLDTVPRELRIARQALVFLEQLRGIAALAVVLAVAVGAAGRTLGPLSAATATAANAILTIVDQRSWSSSHWRERAPDLVPRQEILSPGDRRSAQANRL